MNPRSIVHILKTSMTNSIGCRAGGMSRRVAIVALAGLAVPGSFAATRLAAGSPAQELRLDAAQEPDIKVQGRHRRRWFANTSLEDRYGFHVLGLRLNPTAATTGASTPFAISGYYQFNGDGTLYGKDTVSQNLQIVEREYQGTYQVNPDGTGTLILDISPSFQPEGRFVITKSGEEIEIIFAVPGNLNTFTLKKQSVR